MRTFMETLKDMSAPLIEKLGPLMERLKTLPYYPYSVIGIAALILLLLLLLLMKRRRLSPKKSKQSKQSKPDPNRPRPRVSGVAVGLSSHEEFSNVYTRTPPVVKNDPAPAAAPHVPQAAPAVTPEAAGSTPAQPAAPAVTKTAVPEANSAGTDSELENVIKYCQEKFQSIYTEIYIQFGLMSDFEKFKAEVCNRLQDVKTTRRAISELKMTPQGLILAHMAGVAGGFLQSGQCHIGKGQIDVSGQELMTVYRYSLETMREKGFASPVDVQNKLDFMENKLQELGG